MSNADRSEGERVKVNLDDRGKSEVLIAVLVPMLLFLTGSGLIGRLFPYDFLKLWVGEAALGKVTVYESIAKHAPADRIFLFGDSTAAGFSLRYEASLQNRLQVILKQDESQSVVVNTAVAGAAYRDPISIAGHFDVRDGDRVIVQINAAPKIDNRFYETIHATAKHDYVPAALAPPVTLPWTRDIERYLNYRARQAVPVLAQTASYQAAIRAFLKAKLKQNEGERRRKMWQGDSQLSAKQIAEIRAEYEEIDRESRTATLAQYRILAKAYRDAFGADRVLVYLNPINRTFLESEAGVDWPKLMEWTDQLQAAIEAEGLRVLDLTAELPSDVFFDDNHPDARGSELLAAKLLAEL